MAYPQWMYRVHPDNGFWQATLVTTEAAAAELTAAGFVTDPDSLGVEVVQYPAELVDGKVVHVLGKHALAEAANGCYQFGPPPTVAGYNGGVIAR